MATTIIVCAFFCSVCDVLLIEIVRKLYLKSECMCEWMWTNVLYSLTIWRNNKSYRWICSLVVYDSFLIIQFSVVSWLVEIHWRSGRPGSLTILKYLHRFKLKKSVFLRVKRIFHVIRALFRRVGRLFLLINFSSAIFFMKFTRFSYETCIHEMYDFSDKKKPAFDKTSDFLNGNLDFTTKSSNLHQNQPIFSKSPRVFHIRDYSSIKSNFTHFS